MDPLNETHDPRLRSGIESANNPGTDFPIQNLPFAVFRRRESAEVFRGGVAIGDQILDLRAASEQRLAKGAVSEALAAGAEPTLNRLMGMGPAAWSMLRSWLSHALRAGSPDLAQLGSLLVPQTQAEYSLPASIGDYTDFYASIHHATSVTAVCCVLDTSCPSFIAQT